MKSTISRRAIVETYDTLDRRLSLMSFDATGRRVYTASRYNPFEVLSEAAQQVAVGRQVRIFIDLPDGAAAHPATLADIAAEYLWKGR